MQPDEMEQYHCNCKQDKNNDVCKIMNELPFGNDISKTGPEQPLKKWLLFFTLFAVPSVFDCLGKWKVDLQTADKEYHNKIAKKY